MTQEQYTAKDIQVLEGLEAVRLRPGMYIGSTDQRGLHHLIYEMVDNAVDEAMAGYCDQVRIAISEEGSVRGLRQRKRDSRGPPPRDGQVGPGDGDDHPPRRSQVWRGSPTRCREASTAWAPRW